jgi:hypothetical protein
MVQVSPQQLRDFATNLPPADFTALAEQLKSYDLGGGMPSAGDTGNFVHGWAMQLAGFSKDLSRGIEVFGTMASTAADRFKATDVDQAGRVQTTDQEISDVISDVITDFRDTTPTDTDKPPSDNSKPAPAQGDQKVEPPKPHEQILAPGQFGEPHASDLPTA